MGFGATSLGALGSRGLGVFGARFGGRESSFLALRSARFSRIEVLVFFPFLGAYLALFTPILRSVIMVGGGLKARGLKRNKISRSRLSLAWLGITRGLSRGKDEKTNYILERLPYHMVGDISQSSSPF